MTRRLLTGNAAAAWGARLAGVEYVPAFPITPQTEIIETLASWIDRGEIDARLVTLDSEHSMVTAAGAAALVGARVFTATSSQGLLYAMEMLYTVAGWRAPFVLVNVSRGLSAPITLEPDHNDAYAARDSGVLQIHCATCQEVLDGVIIAHALGEDPRVRLPVLLNLDGFYLSFTREPVEIPAADQVAAFLPPPAPALSRLRGSAPTSQGVAVIGGGAYSYFRYQAHLAAIEALAVYEEVAGRFRDAFGRDHPAVDEHRNDDADIAIVITGSFSTKARAAVDRLRDAGESVGLVRPRLIRPLPAERLRAALSSKRAVVVVDQDLSLGRGGVLHSEVTTALYGLDKPPLVLSFIGGLGGRDIREDEFAQMVTVARDAVRTGLVPAPRLLFTAGELDDVRHLQTIAAAAPEEAP